MKLLYTFGCKISVISILFFGISLSSFSQAGTHLNFDGANDNILATVVVPTTNYTVEFWFRTTKANAGLFFVSDNIEAAYDRDLYLSGGNMNAYVYNTIVPYPIITTTGINYADGNWHHVAHVINSVSGESLYIDGIVRATDAGVLLSQFNWNTRVFIGRSRANSQYSNADIDEVRIWNVARSADDIVRSMNCELQGTETGLMAYYKFNQGLAGQPNPGVTSLTNAKAGGISGSLFNFALTGATSNWQSGSPVTTGITVPDAPVASPQLLCSGSTVADLTASGTGSILWYTTASGGSSLSPADPLATGTYYCATSNASGCVSTRTAVAVTISSPPDGIFYVKADAAGANNGTSWADAFTSLQSALSLSCADTIWVAEGTYRPSVDVFDTVPANPRKKTFYITGGKQIYGGFAGNETSLSQRDIAAHPTILSGDIGVIGNSADNCYHVVVAGGGSGNLTIDGFHIREGRADGFGLANLGFTKTVQESEGGGLWMYKSGNIVYTIKNNHISENASTTSGAGIFYYARLSNQTDIISNNVITGNNGGAGGGLFFNFYFAVSNTTGNFIGNNTALNGGGIFIHSDFPNGGFDMINISNNVLYNNTASAFGGGVYFGEVPVNFVYNTIVNNDADLAGGGISFNEDGNDNFSITNNVFWLNSVNGVTAAPGADFNKTGAALAVFFNNSLQLTAGNYTTAGSGTYDLGATASGNLFAQNPLFANESNIAGLDGLYGTDDDGLRIKCGSPLFHAGIPSIFWPTSDYTGMSRDPSTPSIGAYEYLQLLSTSPSPGYRSMSLNQSSVTIYGDCAGLIAYLQSAGANPINGNTIVATVWTEGIQPAQYVKRHYEIRPLLDPATATGRVTLYFTQAEFDDFNAVNAVDLPAGPGDATGIANLLIEKRGGFSSDASGLPATYSGTITTIDPDDANIVWNATDNRWEITFDVTGFSGFFVKTSGFTLPVTLLNFTANKQANEEVWIQWKTTGEQNLNRYETERSYDGNSFEKTGTVQARNTAGTQEYRFIDNNAWAQEVRYYRLKSVDNDGNYKYSTIIRLVNEHRKSIQLYPNPAGKIVTISVTDAKLLHTRATLMDAGGRAILELNIGQLQTPVNTGRLARGIYWLRFADGSTLKLIKE